MHLFYPDINQNTDSHHYMLDNDGATTSQLSVINHFRDAAGLNHLSHDEALYTASSHGWLTDHGMAVDDMGKLMNAHGVPCHTVSHAGIRDLAQELSKGHQVVLAVHGGDLIAPGDAMGQFMHWLKEAFGLDKPQFSPADHAVVVKGINADKKTVIVCDPTDPNGGTAEYPLDTFMDAWEKSDFTMVATDHAPAGSHGFDDIWDYVSTGVGAIAGTATFAYTGSATAAMAAYKITDNLTDRITHSDDPAMTALQGGYEIYQAIPPETRAQIMSDLIAAI